MGKVVSIVAMALLLAACRGHQENNVTGGYGNGVLSGQVFMASGMANASPAGVRVGVTGTGLSAVVGADGRFAFAGVPDSAELLFSRESDNIVARLSVSATAAPVVVELGLTTASLSSRRGVVSGGSGPLHQYEGLLTAVSATSITVHDSHGADVVLTVDDKTVIRKGNTAIKAADLQVGWRVHVAAAETADTKTAVFVTVQNENSALPAARTAEAHGTVKTVGASSLTVTTKSGDVTVNVDANTVIRKQGKQIQLSDVQVGDTVEANGTRVDDHTLLARQIQVEGAENEPGDDHGGETMTANGTVKAVGSSSLTVTTVPKGDVTVNVDSNTIIRKQGTQIHLTDIKVGDEVNTMGQRVDDHTLLARQIEVRGHGQDDGGGHH